MNLFNCNTDWPICLYDFTIKSKCPNYFVARVQAPLTSFVIDTYFKNSTGGNYKPDTTISTDPCDLLIERNNHLCTSQFETNFKALFTQAE